MKLVVPGSTDKFSGRVSTLSPGPLMVLVHIGARGVHPGFLAGDGMLGSQRTPSSRANGRINTLARCRCPANTVVLPMFDAEPLVAARAASQRFPVSTAADHTYRLTMVADRPVLLDAGSAVGRRA